MPILNNQRDRLTPKEQAELDWEKESARLQVDYGAKALENELEVRKLEVKWSSLFKLPIEVVKLPTKFIMAFAIPISAITKHELSDRYWEFMK